MKNYRNISKKLEDQSLLEMGRIKTMYDLIAYIPVLNKRYLEWLWKNKNSSLYLISQEKAEQLIPRLSRMRTIGLSSMLISSLIRSQKLVRNVYHEFDFDSLSLENKIIMPDEDVCHAFADQHLFPNGIKVSFESIWARYDMTAVKKSQPIQTCEEITSNSFYQTFIFQAYKMAQRSPDWWRQIGACIMKDGEMVVSGFNEHLPNEYEQDAMGDPRMNYEAGQEGEYLSLHAERSCIAQCSCEGFSTLGASMFVTCFPCVDCAREIVKAGIKKVFFIEGYSNLNAQEVFSTYGVSLIKIKDPVA